LNSGLAPVDGAPLAFQLALAQKLLECIYDLLCFKSSSLARFIHSR